MSLPTSKALESSGIDAELGLESENARLRVELADREAQLRSAKRLLGMSDQFPDPWKEIKRLNGLLADREARNYPVDLDAVFAAGTPGSEPPSRDRLCLARAIRDEYPSWEIVSWSEGAIRGCWVDGDGEEVDVLEYWPLPHSEEGWEQTWRRKT